MNASFEPSSRGQLAFREAVDQAREEGTPGPAHMRHPRLVRPRLLGAAERGSGAVVEGPAHTWVRCAAGAGSLEHTSPRC